MTTWSSQRHCCRLCVSYKQVSDSLTSVLSTQRAVTPHVTQWGPLSFPVRADRFFSCNLSSLKPVACEVRRLSAGYRIRLADAEIVPGNPVVWSPCWRTPTRPTAAENEQRQGFHDQLSCRWHQWRVSTSHFIGVHSIIPQLRIVALYLVRSESPRR